MKLKQSDSLNKKIYLPQLKTIESNHITPKYKLKNQSLPKILALNVQQIQSKLMIKHNRNVINDRKPLKERLKALYNRKRDHLQFNNIENVTSPKAVDHADITNNFKREIEKNLVQIKKAKQNNRRQMSKKKILPDRYKSPRQSNPYSEESENNRQNSLRIATQQTVFSKINEIIMTSQAKTSPAHQQKVLSLRSYLNEGRSLVKSRQIEHSRKKIKTQATQTQYKKYSIMLKRCEIKHNQNYHQWRKLSIDSLSNINIKYQNTSYEIETDRLESIRSKNDLSLRKYFEGKDYLQKLISYRESSTLTSKP